MLIGIIYFISKKIITKLDKYLNILFNIFVLDWDSGVHLYSIIL